MHGVCVCVCALCILYTVAVCHQILSFAPLTLKQLNEHNNCYSISSTKYNDSPCTNIGLGKPHRTHTPPSACIALSLLKYSVDLMNLAIFITGSAFSANTLSKGTLCLICSFFRLFNQFDAIDILSLIASASICYSLAAQVF